MLTGGAGVGAPALTNGAGPKVVEKVVYKVDEERLEQEKQRIAEVSESNKVIINAL